MKTLRVGVIGLGVGEQHVLGFQRSKGCRVVMMSDLSREKLAEVSARHPGVKATLKPSDIIGNPDIDIVAIASYDDAHYAQVLAALKAGQHVYVEKPLCRTMPELKAIKAAWRRHKGRVKLASNLVLRAAPLYRWVRDEIRSGKWGDVYAFDGDYLYGRLHKITEGWRKNVPDYSVMEGGGVHLIDLLLWITGERPRFVAGSGNRICTRRTPFRYNDYMSCEFRHRSGLVARITANFGCVHRHHHAMRIFGTKRSFIYDDAGPRLHETRDPAHRARALDLRALPATKGDLIPAFVEAVRRNRDISADTQTFFDAISISAACDRAVASGKVEEVCYV